MLNVTTGFLHYGALDCHVANVTTNIVNVRFPSVVLETSTCLKKMTGGGVTVSASVGFVVRAKDTAA